MLAVHLTYSNTF